MFSKKILQGTALITALLLSSCAYHMQIEQGVALTSDQIAQLKMGLTQDQVSYLLGTPNLTDPYHPNTWYYIYTNKENKKPLVEERLIVHFNDSGLVSSYEQTPEPGSSS